MDGQQSSEQPHHGDPDLARATLVRGRHRWTFVCGLGDGPAFKAALAELTQRSDCPLDRVDAAVVGLQLARELAEGFSKLHGGASPR